MREEALREYFKDPLVHRIVGQVIDQVAGMTKEEAFAFSSWMGCFSRKMICGNIEANGQVVFDLSPATPEEREKVARTLESLYMLGMMQEGGSTAETK